MSYLHVIITAVTVFPFLAALITFPYFIHNYHKYGSISKYRMLFIYTFVLYLLSAYFLVILPLPSIDKVASLTTPRYQLIPFHFVSEFIHLSGFSISSFHAILGAIKSSYFTQPFFNLLLTVPFGVYLRYYCKYSLKKTTICTFLLSLFFELTQLSGLYFIYPRGYRLFDVDDLMLNTLGGALGYFVSSWLKFLPSREKIDEKSYEMGQKVTGFRRMTAFILDQIFIHFLFGIYLLFVFLSEWHITDENITIVYFTLQIIAFIIFPLFFKRTLGKAIVNLKIYGLDQESKWYQRLVRSVLFLFYLYGCPVGIAYLLNKDQMIGGIASLIYFLSLCRSFIQLIRGRTLWYENLTKTKNKNTIIRNHDIIDNIEGNDKNDEETIS